MKKPQLKFTTALQLIELRKRRGLSQSEFWAKISVTQSGGSRYESGRTMPKPVQAMVELAYGTDKQAADLLAWLRQPSE